MKIIDLNLDERINGYCAPSVFIRVVHSSHGWG